MSDCGKMTSFLMTTCADHNSGRGMTPFLYYITHGDLDELLD